MNFEYKLTIHKKYQEIYIFTRVFVYQSHLKHVCVKDHLETGVQCTLIVECVLKRSFTQDPLLDVIGYETDASIKLIGGQLTRFIVMWLRNSCHFKNYISKYTHQPWLSL